MQTIKLNHSGIQKTSQGIKELYYQDIEDIKSYRPGEWCYLEISSNKHYLGFTSSLTDKKNLNIFVTVPFRPIDKITEEKIAPIVLKDLIQKAFKYRELMKVDHGRYFYGEGDLLPGLIIDRYENAVFIQINTMGLFRYREIIKETVENYLKTPCYLLQNANLNRKEIIPVLPEEKIPDDITFEENNIKYTISKMMMQKLGYYFDHRFNRLKFADLCKSLGYQDEALDLFSYVGAWGFNLLKKQISKVTFVDQGDMQQAIDSIAQLNDFKNKITFIRSDVFKFLDHSAQESKRYKIICSDPPAFAKSIDSKKKALEGYLRLHQAVFKIADKGAIIAFASCTHYVDLIDFQKTIILASKTVKRPIKLLDIGIQGFDHPIEGMFDRGNYIKYCAYYVE